MKQTARRRVGAGDAGETEAMPVLGSGQAASGAPVVHNVVLGGGPAGQPVNLLELLMEEPGAGDRTTLMQAPARSSSTARPNAELTVPMQAVGQGMGPGPSDLTAVLQAYRPKGGAQARVPTETDRPQSSARAPQREGESTGMPAFYRGGVHAGSGDTQLIDPSATQGDRPPGSSKQALAERAAPLRGVEPALPVDASPAGIAAAGAMAWVPWLLLAIAVELLAILAVLLMGGKR